MSPSSAHRSAQMARAYASRSGLPSAKAGPGRFLSTSTITASQRSCACWSSATPTRCWSLAAGIALPWSLACNQRLRASAFRSSRTLDMPFPNPRHARRRPDCRTKAMLTVHDAVPHHVPALSRPALAVRYSESLVQSTSRPMLLSVNTLPRVARSSFFISSRRTPNPRPAIQATT